MKCTDFSGVREGKKMKMKMKCKYTGFSGVRACVPEIGCTSSDCSKGTCTSLDVLMRDIENAWKFGVGLIQLLAPGVGFPCAVAGGSVRDLCIGLYSQARERFWESIVPNDPHTPDRCFLPKDIDLFILGTTEAQRVSLVENYQCASVTRVGRDENPDFYSTEHAIALEAQREIELLTSKDVSYDGVIPVQIVFHSAASVEELLRCFDLKNAQFAYVGPSSSSSQPSEGCFSSDLVTPGWDVVAAAELQVNREGYLKNPISTLHRMFRYIDKYSLDESIMSVQDVIFLSSLKLQQQIENG